jgi:purine-binding chemotaxis protein CheW
MTATATTSPTQQILCFALAGESYGIPILKVREIQGQAAITRIPRSPEYMPGVINLRGAIVPIIELRARFALGEAEVGTRNVIIIVEVQERTIGIRVDSVQDVLDLRQDQVKPPPEWGGSGNLGREFIEGLASLPHGEGAPDEMIILLNLDRLLSSMRSGP